MYGRILRNTINKTGKVAVELGLPISFYSTNICTAFEDYKAYIGCYTFFMSSKKLGLGTNFKKYYYSSSFDWSELSLNGLYDKTGLLQMQFYCHIYVQTVPNFILLDQYLIVLIKQR